MTVLLGFDPGGEGKFGWCVCEDAETLPLTIRETGCAGTVRQALDQSLARVGEDETVLAAALDAPLFWVETRTRRVDEVMRQAVRLAGAPHPPGTVQHVNSLRGACVAQGMLAAVQLRRRLPQIVLSESHPKALLWLLGIPQGPYDEFLSSLPKRSEHERDAAVSCLNAWAAVQHPSGWVDLAAQDPDRYSPVEPVSYWMPVVALRRL